MNTSTRLTGTIFSSICCKRPSWVAGGRFEMRIDLVRASATRLKPISDLVTSSAKEHYVSRLHANHTYDVREHEDQIVSLLSSASLVRNCWQLKQLERHSVIQVSIQHHKLIDQVLTTSSNSTKANPLA